MDNYEKLLDRISRSSGLDKSEIERKVEAKKAKLSGLISREGAAQIVAAELGINFDSEKMKISELVDGMKRVNVIGKVVRINPIREFNKNGRQGKVAALLLADESSNVRTVLWDTNHISLFETGKIKENDVVDISNGAMRNGELHLSSFSDIKISKERIDKAVLEAVVAKKKLGECRPGESVKTRAIIVKTFEPRYFEVHPTTGKKLTQEDIENNIAPAKRALLNVVIDDGSETMRSVLFMEQILSLGLTEDQIMSLEEFNKIKDSLLGEEKIFSGQVKTNSLYNTTEFSISRVEPIDPDVLLKELEAKA
jgi:replication factor A1